MAEQQLVDYIKKAKDAGQADEQTKSLLLKNGWTEPEINAAFAALGQPQAQPKVQPQTQPQPQPQISAQPKIQPQTQPTSQPKPQTQPQPSTQPQYKPQAQPTPGTMIIKKSGSHTLIKILLSLIIVIVLAGGGLFLAAQYFDIPWNPFAMSPDAVVAKMFANMKDVKSNHSIISSQATVTSSGIEQGRATFTFEGDGDMNDPKNIKGNTSVNFNATTAITGEPSTTTVAFSAKALGNLFYVKIDDLVMQNDTLGADVIPGVKLEQLKGQWIKVDSDSLKTLSKTSGQPVSLDLSEIQNSEFSNQLKNIFADEKILTFSNKLADESIDGQSTYHYLMKISKDNLKVLASKILDLQIEEAAKTQPGVDMTLASNVAKTLASSIIDKLGDIDVETWIGKKNFFLYRLQVNKTIDISNLIAGFGVPLPETNMSANISLSVNNSKFNEQVVVEEPAGAIKIEELLGPVLKIQQMQSILNSISITAGSLSTGSKSYTGLCYKGLLNGYEKTYGKDLGGYATEIIANGGKNPACFANASSYCVSTQLEDGTWLCTGKGVPSGTTKCLSALTVCQ